MKKAVEVNSKSFAGCFGLGIAQHELRKRSDAIKSLGKAIHIDPSSIKSYILLGIVQRDSRQFNLAEQSLLKAKTLSDHQSSDTNWHLALLYYHDLKNHNAAAEEFNSYLKNLSKTDKKKNPEKVEAVKKLIERIRANASNKS